jgi:PEP-CTERM motif
MMNHRLALGAAAIAAVVSMPAFAGNLVTNGSVEDNFGFGQFRQTLPGSPGGQTGAAPGTNAPGWTVSGTNSSFPGGYAFIFENGHSLTNSVSSVGPFSQFGNPGGSPHLPLWAGTHSVPNDSGEGTSFYGVDSTFQPSELTQEITGLTVGDKYTLTFDYAAAQQLSYNGNTIDDWVVMLGGQTIASTHLDLPSNQFSGWFTDTVTFTYEGIGTDPGLLSFVNNGMGGCNSDFMGCAPNNPAASGGPPFSLLDSVSLSSVPEPSTWVMMLAGFAGHGYAGLRSRRRSAISVA